jgi:hypothetical protein
LALSLAIHLTDCRSCEINRHLANFGAKLSKSLRLTEDRLAMLDNSEFPDPPTAASSSATLRERPGRRCDKA